MDTVMDAIGQKDVAHWAMGMAFIGRVLALISLAQKASLSLG